MNRLLLPLLFCLFTLSLQAQQMAQFTQFYFNKLYFSPSFAGADADWNEFSLIHRSQWAGYSSQIDPSIAPTTTILTGSLPFHKREFGIGFYFLNETIGPFTNQVFQVSGAWHRKLKSNGATISLGAQVGIYNKVLDFGVLRPREQDPLITSTGRLNSIGQLPDLAFGAGYSTKKYFVHTSLQQVSQASFSYDGRQMAPLAMHVFIMAAYHFELSQRVKLSPMAVLKTETNLFSYEVGALSTYNDWVWMGIFHRQSESIAVLAGLNLDKAKKFRLSYSFDFLVVNQAVRNATSAGSHEVVLSYRIPKFSLYQRSPVRTPRFRLD